MKEPINKENERAHRICLSTNDCHDKITTLYECLCDREFKKAEKEIKDLQSELRLITKYIKDDDF